MLKKKLLIGSILMGMLLFTGCASYDESSFDKASKELSDDVDAAGSIQEMAASQESLYASGILSSAELSPEEVAELTPYELITEIVCSAQDDSLQQVKFYTRDYENYIMFLPSELEGKAKVFFKNFDVLSIDGNHDYHSGDVLTDLEDGETYTARMINNQGEEAANVNVIFYQADSVPTMYIRTDVGSTDEIDMDKSIKETATFSIMDLEGNLEGSGACRINARGQHSFSADQKSYNIRTDKSIEPFGLGSAREWSLLANYSESDQMLRNMFTFYLSKGMGLTYTPECHFVNLYVDKEFRGLFLLTQRPTIDGGSVKIHDLKEDHKVYGDKFTSEGVHVVSISEGTYSYNKSSVTSDIIDGGYLLQICSRYDQEDNYFTQTCGFPVAIKNPSILSTEEMNYITDYTRQAIETLADDNSTDEEIEQYFDYDSWSKVYLMNEFAVQWDVEFDNFKFYKGHGDDHLYAGPVWDFDMAYGHMATGEYPTLTSRTLWIQDDQGGWLNIFNNWDGYEMQDEEGGWLHRLGHSTKFSNLVEQTYLEEMHHKVEECLNATLEAARENETSSYMNRIRWDREEEDYWLQVGKLTDWIKDRDAFLNDYYSHKDEYCKVVFEFEWAPMAYYVKKGDKLGFLPNSLFGESNWNTESYPEPNYWESAAGNEIDENTVITQDMYLIKNFD